MGARDFGLRSTAAAGMMRIRFGVFRGTAVLRPSGDVRTNCPDLYDMGVLNAWRGFMLH